MSESTTSPESRRRSPRVTAAIVVVIVAIFAAGAVLGLRSSPKSTAKSIVADLRHDQILHWTATQEQNNSMDTSPLGKYANTKIDAWTDLRTNAVHAVLVTTLSKAAQAKIDDGPRLEVWNDGNRTTWTLNATGSPKNLHKAIVYKQVAAKHAGDAGLSPALLLEDTLKAVEQGHATLKNGASVGGTAVVEITQRSASSRTVTSILRTSPPRLISAVDDESSAATKSHNVLTTTGWTLFPITDATARSHVDANFDPAKYDVQDSPLSATTP